ncbi:MAG: hypothetical protein KGL39_21840 [Patescibacteria group bacterium]|nr:hypothetical protein [Patescibacteria group bacterium]
MSLRAALFEELLVLLRPATLYESHIHALIILAADHHIHYSYAYLALAYYLHAHKEPHP